jgi:AAA+ superfamily predicted ATPase
MSQPYADNLSHLQEELAWLEELLRYALQRQQASPDTSATETAGETALPREGSESRRAAIDARVAASLARGVELRLPRLERLFSISPFERDVLLLCLAPEVDEKYGLLYAYLQDDATCRAPRVGLVQRLFCDGLREQGLARRAFHARARLMRYAIVEFADTQHAASSLLARPLRVDPGIAAYLLGAREIDSRLAHGARLEAPDPQVGTSGAAAALSASLNEYLGQPGPRQWIAHLHGPDPGAKENAARAVCSAAELACLFLDLSTLTTDAGSFEPAVRLAFRDAALAGAALYLEVGSALSGDAFASRHAVLEAAMRDMGWITFLASAEPIELGSAWKRQGFVAVEFPLPGFSERKAIWETALKGYGDVDPDVSTEDLAARYRLTEREIGNAVSVARGVRQLRAPGAATLTQADLQAACRAESSTRLRSFGHKVQSRYSWADLVLPAAQKQQLREVVDHIRFHERVYADWGFGDKHSLGRGNNVLFSGPSGTGKTMAAGIIATELGLDIYKIDLSAVVSKYIGETEKNLSRIFTAAETANAILFFDEADALFGRRSEVKDSHDRYANVEINYLLQRMEEHEGIVILATNLSRNLDDAFLRRIQFAVTFPQPEKEERLLLWRQVFPAQAPLATDLDFDFLARRFKLTGGSIKNIAVGAAYLAQCEGGAIGMRHVVLAAKREFQKMGKICAKAEFGDYYELVA